MRHSERRRRRRTQVRFGLRGAAVGIAAALVLVGCAASPDPAVDEEFTPLDVSGIDLADYSGLVVRLDVETGTVALPIDAIDRKSDALLALRQEARRALVDSCLREQGLRELAWPEPSASDEDRTFGLWSVSLASRYGLELPSTVDESVPLAATPEQSNCLATAKAQLSASDEALDAVALDTLIGITAYSSTIDSEEGRSAIAESQRCMVDRGLSLDPASGFPRTDASSGDSEANIRIATEWATCNIETGAVQVLFDLLARYQAALIDENEAAAVELARQRQALIDEFESIIARAG